MRDDCSCLCGVQLVNRRMPSQATHTSVLCYALYSVHSSYAILSPRPILTTLCVHSKDIAYRDMKPENCLIDKHGYPKLVDFGFAKIINGKSFTLCGTPEYLAPELVLGRGHNRAVDYWAFGILLYEMEAGYSPFSDPQGMDQVVICKNIVNGKLVFPRNFNNDCKVS